MARFVRDEKRTYPFTWLIVGGIFAFSSFWAIYAELVTRVPWQAHQEAFFDLELEQATQAKAKAEAELEAAKQQEPLKGQLAARAKLEEEMKSGAYADAKAKLAELDLQFANAEKGKTFGASDLDEAYYYRNLAEYGRDEAQVAVRNAFKAAYEEDPNIQQVPNGIYADPPKPARKGDVTDAIFHLQSEVLRAEAHVAGIDEALKAKHPAAIVAALEKSRATEMAVKSALLKEQQHQGRIDKSVAEMTAIDGPPEPREATPAAYQAACKGKEQTRRCLRWLVLDPKDKQLKKLTLAISKSERSLKEAELRLDKAKVRADPPVDLSNLMQTLVGPFQIQQIVTSWMVHERDVDIQQVDRCHTCHMGVDSGNYTDASIQKEFRTHPNRKLLFASHPIDKFGCTVCHQGQGRATDNLAHSKWQLELHHGKERWHYAGDHYWEDPLLPTGKLSKIIIDEQNDELEVKFGKGKKGKVKLDHGVLPGEKELFEALQKKLAEHLGDLQADWGVVAHKVDNRVTLGLTQIDPTKVVEAKKRPRVQITFLKRGVAELLGFHGVSALDDKNKLSYTAAHPPVQPVRAEQAAAQVQFSDGEDYSYAPPTGEAGLQIPDEMRSRFIQALPEIEAGCLRCHQNDTDLVPHRSAALFVDKKLAYEKAEALKAKDPEAFEAEYGGTLPKVTEQAGELTSLAPTLDEGRRLFTQLNCTGCHLLEGFQNNPEQGPQLNDIAAKVSPEWLLSWLRYPRAWRAKTSMPNLWPRPLDPASKLPYPKGSPEYQKWERQRRDETVAVAAFLIERSENPPNAGSDSTASDSKRAPLWDQVKGYADVEGASAELGKKVFESYGCQGCHANVDGGKELPEAWRQRERDIAPTLSNLGHKTNADWIAYWVENPARYWHGAAMPNLRLSRVEAASVGKYLVSLKTDTPRAVVAPAEDVALVTSADKRQALVPCRMAGGARMTRVECGKRVIDNRGCFGCHNINGYEKASPIGPELSGFAKKDITTLDYGYAIADHHMQTTETFAALKLDSPRIYARDRIELRMGDYDLSAAEIRALVVFLKGTVADKPREAFDPRKQGDFAASMDGRRLVIEYNCRGCHQIEGRGADINGWRASILTQDPQRRAPHLDGEGARVQPEWLFDFLRDPQTHAIRPWLHPEWVWGDEVPDDKRALRMPTFNLTPEQWTAIVRYFSTWDKRSYPFQVPKARQLDKQERLYTLTHMNSPQAGNCLSCHFHGEFPLDRGKADLGKMAPNFDIVRKRLRPEWVKNWLLRPQNYLSYTKMTAFWATKDRPKGALFAKEQDPFISPPAVGWDKVPFREVTGEQQVELVRDFLFNLPPGASFPAPGQEAGSPLVDPSILLRSATAPEAADDGEAGDAAPAEPPAEPPKTGSVPGPARF
jgi:cytochrome c551/c552